MRKMLLLAAAAPFLAAAGPSQLLIGIDGKTFFEAAAVRNGPGGKDLVAVLDISDPAHPQVTAQLPLPNTVFGPPTNLQITPDGKLGLVANSIVTAEKDGAWTVAPDDTLHVLDMTAQPPKLVETIKVGRQPSGLSIGHDGRTALVANRAGKSVSMLRIDGTSVKQVAEVALPDQAAAVAIAPDGKRAFVAMNLAGTVGVLAIDGDRVTYDKKNDIPTGPGVYNLDITPDGRTVVAANTATDGNGSLTTLALIDAAGANPHVAGFAPGGPGAGGRGVGPGGEGVGGARGAGGSGGGIAPGYHPNGVLQVFGLNGQALSLAGGAELGAIPEGVAWSPDSQWLYVGNYNDKTLQVFHMEGGNPMDARTVPLPGQPASLRGAAR